MVTWVVLPAALLTVAVRRGLLCRESLGLHPRVRGRRHPALLLALVVIVAYLFLEIDMWALHRAHAIFPSAELPPDAFTYRDVVPPRGPRTGGWRLLALTYLCVSAAVVEELYYRAAFDRLFPRTLVGAVAYVLTSSSVFAGAHWEGGLRNVAESFAVGLFAAVVFRVTGNLWPLMVGHLIVDWYWLDQIGG